MNGLLFALSNYHESESVRVWPLPLLLQNIYRAVCKYKMDSRGAEIIACVSTNKRANCGRRAHRAIRRMEEWEQVGAIME